jgi:hypothetical protein
MSIGLRFVQVKTELVTNLEREKEEIKAKQ